MSDLYVYLETEAHVRTWVEGGELPIKSASAYLDQEQRGSLTPDETFVFSGVGVDPRQAMPYAGWPLGATVINSVIIGGPRTSIISEYRREDGLVLCFAKVLSERIARGFDRRYCVKVNDWAMLKLDLDRQLGEVGQAGPCQYPAHSYLYQRGPFHKGVVNWWQREFRFYWPKIPGPRNVNLPPETAVAVSVVPSSRLSRCPCRSGHFYKHCHGRAK